MDWPLGELCVVIEKQKHWRTRFAYRLIVCPSKSDVFAVLDQRDLMAQIVTDILWFKPVHGSVGRGVIHNHDLIGGARLMTNDAINGPSEEQTAVPVHDNHA